MQVSSTDPWFRVEDESSIASPALLVYPDRVGRNIDLMIQIAQDLERLTPHLKTAKMGQIVSLYRERGITRFKCATIAEAELAARFGARSVLVAYPLLGPHPRRLARLVPRYPQTEFAAIVDSAEGLAQLEGACKELDVRCSVFLDLDVGMHRTGIPPGPDALDLYRRLADSRFLSAGGIHAYDGHIHETDVAARSEAVRRAFEPVEAFVEQLTELGLPVARQVCGGSYSFPIHARVAHRECSPGTSVFWDAGYRRNIPDLPFLWAAVVATRVVSHPERDLFCLDLGYKAIAAEQPFPRAQFLNGEDLTEVGHSEEHLVVRAANPDRYRIGQLLYAVPRHICPTVSLYDEALVVDTGRVVDRWPVAARRRELLATSVPDGTTA